MNKTLKTLSLLLLLSGLFLFSSVWAQSLEKTLIQFTKEYGIYSYNYNSGDIILFYPRKGLSTEFTTKGTSAKYLTTLKEQCVAINGFYFGKGNNGENFQPAWPLTRYVGLWKDPIVIPSDTNPADDVNLQNQIFYNSINNQVSMNKFITLAKGVSFYAGPMIITDGIANPDLTKKISHRSTKHYRTFLIQDEKNKAVRGITTEKVSLPELAIALNTIFKNKKINVVNLDGWSSTSFSSDKISYNASKALPSFFHSCK